MRTVLLASKFMLAAAFAAATATASAQPIGSAPIFREPATVQKPCKDIGVVVSSHDPATAVASKGPLVSTSQPLCGKVILLAGSDGLGLNDVHASGDGQTWHQLSAHAPASTTKWSPRAHVGGKTVFFNNRIWVIGGDCFNAGQCPDAWSSPDGATWTQTQSNLPFSTFGSEPWVFNNRLYVLANDWLDMAVWSTADGVTWKFEAAAPFGPGWRVMHSVSVFQGRVWVLGGYDAAGEKSEIWSSSDSVNFTHVDTSAAPGIQDAPWEPRREHTSLVFNNKLWILGGSHVVNGSAINIGDVWSSPDGVHWTQALANAPWAHHAVGQTLGYADDRYAHSSFVLNGKMFVIHGRAPSDTCGLQGACDADGEIWSSPDGVNWTQVMPLGDPIVARWSHSTVVPVYPAAIDVEWATPTAVDR